MKSSAISAATPDRGGGPVRPLRISAAVLALLAATAALLHDSLRQPRAVLLLDASRSASGSLRELKSQRDAALAALPEVLRPADIVLFGATAAAVETDGGSLSEGDAALIRAMATCGEASSRLDAGIHAALARLHAGEPGSLFVSTDRFVPGGDTLDAALDAARRRGVTVTFLKTSTIPAPAPRAAALDAPPVVRAGGRFPLTVLVTGSPGAAGTVRLEDESAGTAETRSFVLPVGGRARLSFAAGSSVPGLRSYGARVEEGPPGAVATTSVLIESAGALLRAGETPLRDGWSGLLAEVGGAPAVDLHGESARAILETMDLSATPALVLDGSARWLNAAVASRIGEAVQRGMGLLVVDERSDGDGGSGAWSSLGRFLPVLFSPPDGARPRVILAVDVSASMAENLEGGMSSAEICRGASLRLVDALPDEVVLHLVRFGDALHDAGTYDLGTADGRVEARRAAGEIIAPGGGTRFTAAVDGVLGLLAPGSRGPTLLLLVTDGQPADGVEAAGAAGARLAAAGIPTRIVRPGDAKDADAAFEAFREGAGAQSVEMRGDGVPALAALLERESATLTAGRWEKGSVAVIAGSHPAPWGSVPPGLPRVDGHLRAFARPDAEVWLRTDGGSPLLVAGRSGLGRVAVFLSGPDGEGGSWMREPARRLMVESIAHVLREPGLAGVEAEALVGEDGMASLSLRLPRAPEGDPEVSVEGTVLQRTGPAEWNARVAAGRSGGTVVFLLDGAVVARVPERQRPSREDLLEPTPGVALRDVPASAVPSPGVAGLPLLLLIAAAALLLSAAILDARSARVGVSVQDGTGSRELEA